MISIKERVHIYVNTLYIGIVIMCSTFHHCIVYNPKGINTKGWLVYQSFITIIQKTLSNLKLVSEQKQTSNSLLSSSSLLSQQLSFILLPYIQFSSSSKNQERVLPIFFLLWTIKNFIILLHLHPNLLSPLWRRQPPMVCPLLLPSYLFLTRNR